MFYSVGFIQNLVYLGRHLNGFVPILMKDLCYGPRKFISKFEFGLRCTAGLLPRAIAFHDLCKQIIYLML